MVTWETALATTTTTEKPKHLKLENELQHENHTIAVPASCNTKRNTSSGGGPVTVGEGEPYHGSKDPNNPPDRTTPETKKTNQT
jgi:hypothetical protein